MRRRDRVVTGPSGGGASTSEPSGRRPGRRIVGPVLVALTCLVPALSAAQPGAEARIPSLMSSLAEELRRVQVYLAYSDQLLRMQVAQGALTAEGAERLLAERGALLYRQSYTEADLQALVAQHRTASAAYFQRIDGAIGAARQWPPGTSPARARQQLEQAARDHAAALARREDVRPALRRANEVLAWASGFASLPPSLDHFGGQFGRVMASIPSRVPALAATMRGQGTLPPVRGADEPALGGPGPVPPGTPLPGDLGNVVRAPVTPPPPIVVAPPVTLPSTGVTSPPPPAHALERANALLQQWKWQEALVAYDEALRADPASVEAQLGRGRVLNAVGDVAGAIRSYETALQARPAMPNVRLWLAELWLSAGDPARAEARLQEELRMFPPTAWARSYEGTLHLMAGRQAEAQRAMGEAIRLDAGVAAQRFNNASALAASSQHRRAAIEFASVLALDPNAAGAYYGLGASYANLGAVAQAIGAYESYLARDGSSEWAARARSEIARLRASVPVPNPAGHPTGVVPLCSPGTSAVGGACVPAR